MHSGRFVAAPSFTPWWWEAAPRPVLPAAALPEGADVAIVGSGYTGLSAALTLARAGRAVVVLEARQAGCGASTRNGGQIGSGNQKFTVARLVAQYGEAKARALVSEGAAMLRYIAELIETERIECHFRRVGRFRGAVRPSHYAAMARDLEDLKRFAGVEYFMVPRPEQHKEVGTDFYHGGSVLPQDGALHPGLYHQGLLDRVLAAGALVLEHTPVTALQPRGTHTRVLTARGAIEAGAAIVATNGYTGPGLMPFHRRLVPIGTAIIATETLEPSLMQRVMPAGRVYGNTARVFHYFRPSPDHKRMLFGGRVGRLAAEDSPRAYAHLQREMVRVFPDLRGVRISHGWSGYIAYTTDVFPHLGCHDGIWYALGYCGTGVSRSTYFGHKIALKVLGDPAGCTAFDDLAFNEFSWRWAAPVGVAAVEGWYRLQDALGI